ncbi:MAG: protein kinase, partial [Planctomycetaceae bacterium]|nr:protein kinase [Planctomycetaceae bacterium]
TIYQAERITQGNFQGLVLGNYLILNQIGAGGMGQVFLAEHKRMGRRVALKTLPQSLANDPTIVSRFEREVLAAAKLSHPNIVTAHDADEANGIHFFVMEYIHGVDLSKLVNQHGPLSINLALNLVIQTAQGLRYAHERGIIHRDIKPANLLVTPEGTVKILDMGLARLESDDESHATSLTTAGSMLGTVNYMSPEQALDTHTADARSDIYSLGCVLYFLLTGDAVYEGKTAIQKILAHREEPIPSLRTRLPNLPEQLDLIFQKMLVKNPDERYQTMSQVLEELEACQPADLTETETSLFSNSQPDDDSELYYFSEESVQASNRTVVQPPSSQDTSAADRLSAARLQDTLIGDVETEPYTQYESTTPPRKRPALWLISGGLLAVVLLVSSTFLILQNKSGMATRADIPEAPPVGNTGMVTRVEHRLPEEPEKPSVPPETTEMRTEDFALAFDGEDDYVELPLTTNDLEYPLTVEATVLCRQQKAVGEVPIVSLFFQDGIHQLLGYDFEDGNWLALKKTSGHMSEKKSSSRPGLLLEKTQLAAVFDKETVSLFVNGKEQKQG